MARQLPLHVPARGTCEQHVQLGYRASRRNHRLDEHVRPLDQLRLEALPPTHAVLLERPHEERVVRETETAALRGPRARATQGKAVDVDPDGDREHPLLRDASLEDEAAHLGMRHLDAVDSEGVAAQLLVHPIEVRCPVRSGAAVQIRDRQPMRRGGDVRPDRVAALVEDALAARRADPVARSRLDPQTGSRCLERFGVLVERPADPVAHHEQPRVVGPAARRAGPDAVARPVG